MIFNKIRSITECSKKDEFCWVYEGVLLFDFSFLILVSKSEYVTVVDECKLIVKLYFYKFVVSIYSLGLERWAKILVKNTYWISLLGSNSLIN
jgi:hypothetical protein